LKDKLPNPIIGFLILAATEAFLEMGIWATIGKKIKYKKGFIFGLYHFVVGIGSFISLFSLGFIVRIKV
jgi:hypothetical protein